MSNELGRNPANLWYLSRAVLQAADAFNRQGSAQTSVYPTEGFNHDPNDPLEQGQAKTTWEGKKQRTYPAEDPPPPAQILNYIPITPSGNTPQSSSYFAGHPLSNPGLGPQQYFSNNQVASGQPQHQYNQPQGHPVPHNFSGYQSYNNTTLPQSPPYAGPSSPPNPQGGSGYGVTQPGLPHSPPSHQGSSSSTGGYGFHQQYPGSPTPGSSASPPPAQSGDGNFLGRCQHGGELYQYKNYCLVGSRCSIVSPHGAAT